MRANYAHFAPGARIVLDCGGKGAAGDTALDLPERQNVLGRSRNQSGVDAQALCRRTPKGALDVLDCGGKGAASDTALDFPERLSMSGRPG